MHEHRNRIIAGIVVLVIIVLAAFLYVRYREARLESERASERLEMIANTTSPDVPGSQETAEAINMKEELTSPAGIISENDSSEREEMLRALTSPSL